jgi:hypothetical protein
MFRASFFVGDPDLLGLADRERVAGGKPDSPLVDEDEQPFLIPDGCELVDPVAKGFDTEVATQALDLGRDIRDRSTDLAHVEERPPVERFRCIVCQVVTRDQLQVDAIWPAKVERP